MRPFRAIPKEANALRDGAWQEIGRFAGPDRVSVAPFEAISIDLSDLWMAEDSA